ncbi:MAG: NAD-dependent epimerase/dehydratase family protein [Schleiferiaceae bacterium]|jgi:nucleoside-diphosphate-sugar epimerase|nr:NAD-dependent epimerase/dehydratase family protein [Schleiferiaceae bacterium]
MSETILVTGSSGQIGTELVMNLRKIYGNDHVIASDIREPNAEVMESGPFEKLNVMDRPQIFEIVKKYKVTQVYHLVAMLSATAEKVPEAGWDLNMKSFFYIMELAREGHLKKVYWPSSIAVFGPTTPRINTPQHTIMEPTTVYGISKQTGERWCEYYFNKYGVDVRSIRYPGLISWKSEPGGGTTDYAVDIFYEALKTGKYTSFLKADTGLPMMYMEDAIRGTIELVEAPAEKVKIRSSYNFSSLSFTPEVLAQAIQKEMPDFSIDYNPDFRQAIAETWPESIDDHFAREHWGWKHNYDLNDMVKDMLKNLRTKLNIK